jgi:lipopolysaccharide/colanic/teichoic acid biosynthesis glycosyltransferase
VVRLPADEQEYAWRTFPLRSLAPEDDPDAPPVGAPLGWRGLLFRFLPGLLHVARGQLGFVGVPPRSREEIKRLPETWQKLYLKAKAGLVTQAGVYHGPNPGEDEVFAAEAYYVATAGWKTDLKLLLRYLFRSTTGYRRPKAAAEPEGGEPAEPADKALSGSSS